MVPDLVAEDTPDGRAHLLQRAAAHLDGALIDADLVRQDQTVVMGTLRLRDTMIET